MEITTETAQDVAVIRFAGSADAAAVDAIRATLGEMMAACGCRLVCDLSGVDFICSDALGAFISAHEDARAVGGFVRLLQPQPRIRDVLGTTQLNRLFDIYDSLDAALKG
jgi:anti-sigma B factor antagonist